MACFSRPSVQPEALEQQATSSLSRICGCPSSSTYRPIRYSLRCLSLVSSSIDAFDVKFHTKRHRAQSAQYGIQGVFLQRITRLSARKIMQQTSRVWLITDLRKLCRGSLTDMIAFNLNQLR